VYFCKIVKSFEVIDSTNYESLSWQLCSNRKTKNHRNVIVNAIGKEKLQHIFDLADVYHCENMDKFVAFTQN
jgi:hypothetical protein